MRNCNSLSDQLVYHDLYRVIVVQDEDTDEESDDEYEANEETALESYTTPLDEDSCSVDEYVVFKEVLQRMYQIFFLNMCRKTVNLTIPVFVAMSRCALSAYYFILL